MIRFVSQEDIFQVHSNQDVSMPQNCERRYHIHTYTLEVYCDEALEGSEVGLPNVSKTAQSAC